MKDDLSFAARAAAAPMALLPFSATRVRGDKVGVVVVVEKLHGQMIRNRQPIPTNYDTVALFFLLFFLLFFVY